MSLTKTVVLSLIAAQCAGAQGTISGASGNAVSTPFTYETRRFQVGFVKPATPTTTNCAASASIDLLNYSGGPGSIEQIQIAVGANGTSHSDNLSFIDSLITVKVDGSTVMSAPLGLLIGAYGQNATPGPQFFANKNIAFTGFTTNAISEGYLRIYIPFTSSIQVSYTNSGSAAVGVYSQVVYYKGQTPQGLRSPLDVVFHATYTAFTAVTAFSSITLLPAVSGSGRLDSIRMFVFGTTASPTFMEGHPVITSDGDTAEYGGTEDLFGGQSDFSQFITRTDQWGVSFFGPSGSSFFAGLYRFFSNDVGSVNFGSSLTYSWTNGQSGIGTPPTVQVAALVIYYTPN